MRIGTERFDGGPLGGRGPDRAGRLGEQPPLGKERNRSRTMTPKAARAERRFMSRRLEWPGL